MDEDKNGNRTTTRIEKNGPILIVIVFIERGEIEKERGHG